MVEREEGTAAHTQRQGQNQQQNQQIQDPVGQQQHLHINWSNFKPEFSRKPEEDAEAHLLCSNDWMNAHHFVNGVKVQRFCLTLLGEARLWFQSLEPLNNVTWPELQNLFRQRYSKLGNMQEQIFYVWRSFNFNENRETIDSYVTRIRQVAELLGYGEPQVLEVFKNTLPTKLYLISFPIEDLRQAVETAKRILTKEKVDKRLAGQTSASPFMNITEGTERKVSFNARDELGEEIDKLTVMMNRLAARDSNEKRPFKPQIYKSRGQSRCYNQRGYQNRNNRPRQSYIDNNFRENTRGYRRQNSRGEYGNNRHNDYNRSRNRSRERTFVLHRNTK